MNAFAAARLAQALYWLQNAADHLDGAVDRIPRDCVMRSVGELTAMKQLLELEADLLEKADTERPSHLRVVASTPRQRPDSNG